MQFESHQLQLHKCCVFPFTIFALTRLNKCRTHWLLNGKSLSSSMAYYRPNWVTFLLSLLFLFSAYLPWVSSRPHSWSWMSMVPVHCSPGISFQLESSCPQTDVHSPDTASAEIHNPAGRTSLHAFWCRCLVPSPAAGPVGLPWMPSSPWMVLSWAFTSWTQSRRVFVPDSFIATIGDGKTGWDHRQGGASGGQVKKP